MSRPVLVRYATNQHNGCSNYQFGNGPRIGIRRIEHDHPVFCRRTQINLVYADAKTTNGLQFSCRFKNLWDDMCLRPDAENMDLPDFLYKFLFAEGPGNFFHLHIPMLAKVLYRCITNIFQEQDTYFFFWITCLGWLHICKYAHKLINK